jgi:hypothetical protein
VPGVDHAIAAQAIMLGATERGLGGCMVGLIEKDGLCKVMDIPDQYEILLVLALGKSAERVVIEDVGADGSYRYYRVKKTCTMCPSAHWAN